MANANIKQIFQEFPSIALSPDDLLVFYNETTGTTRAIKASAAITNTSDNQSFIWTSTGEYNTGDVVIYQGQWYISLVDNNEVIPTADNVNWELENKVTAITIAPWLSGIYEQHYTVVSVGSVIYRLKDTATLPFNSQTTPENDSTNWESFGAGVGINRFENLLDTFNFVGEALKFPRVDAAENALEPYDLFGSLARFTNRLEADNFFKLRSPTVSLSDASLSNYAVTRSHITFVNTTQVMTINSINLNVTAEKDILFAISNLGDFNIIIKESSTATGAADNKFYIPSDLILSPGDVALFMYQSSIFYQDGFYLISRSQGGTSYTDAQARGAQAGSNDTLPIKLNSVGPKIYGETTALSVSEITFDLLDSIIGGAAIVHHNASEKPTIATDFNVLEHGDYVNSVLNQIFFIQSGSSSLSIAYTQPVFTQGTADNTAPTIESATIENGNANRLVVVYSETVTQADTTGFAISGDATISVNSIVSGVNTNIITYAISPNAQGGQSLILNVGSGNNVTDLSSNANTLATVNIAIINNIGAAQQLNTPTGSSAENLTSNSIRLRWNSVTDADNYVLERALQPNYSDASVIYLGSNLTFDDTGLTENTTYYYRIKAIDNVDNIFGDSNYATLNIVAQLLPPLSINSEFMYHKFDTATTNADPVTLSNDSLTSTPYSLVNIGTVNRSIQNARECVLFSSGNYLQTGLISPLFLQDSFSINLEVKLLDGNPTTTEYFCGFYVNMLNRFWIDLRADGKLTVGYTAGGQSSVFAQTLNPVFADGATSDFVNLQIVVTSGVGIAIYRDNVLQPLVGSFNGSLSSTNMALFSGSANFRVGAGDTGISGIIGMNGYMRDFIIQPVAYNSQQRTDLLAL